jgi:hypothetical protein
MQEKGSRLWPKTEHSAEAKALRKSAHRAKYLVKMTRISKGKAAENIFGDDDFGGGERVQMSDCTTSSNMRLDLLPLFSQFMNRSSRGRQQQELLHSVFGAARLLPERPHHRHDVI